MPRVPPEHSRFKKGQSGNPGGRAKLSAEMRAIGLLTKDEINALFAKYARMSRDEMQEVLRDTSLPALEVWIASGIVNGIKTGDWHNMHLMFDRIFGRPKPEEIKPLDTGIQNHIEGIPGTEGSQPISQPPPGIGSAEIVDEDDVPTFIVSLNQRGKFVHARPRLLIKKAENE